MQFHDRKSTVSRCTVVGGSGLLGRNLVEGLLERGYQVNVFDIRASFEDDRVHFFTGDLCNKEVLLPALTGVSVVFHCASPSPHGTDRDLFLKVNVEGTKTIIEACKEANVKKLVVTSSANVVYEGKDVINATEEFPYASKPYDCYTESKILQEKLVLEANTSGDDGEGPELLTVALRPYGIFGPRDQHVIHHIAVNAKLYGAGLTFIIGNGKNIADFTYVENVVHGHILAAENLHRDSPLCGQAYNITNDSPSLFWDFVSRIAAGVTAYPPGPRYKVPYYLAYFVAVLLTIVSFLLRPLVTWKPIATTMMVDLSVTSMYFNCEKAKRDFGYEPVVSFDEGMRRTLEYYQHSAKKD